MFGGAATSNPFGGAAAGGTNLFGTAPAAGGLFGAAPKPAAGGLFGAAAPSPSAAGASLFGAPAAPAPAGGGLFGSSAPAPAPFGGGGLFGGGTTGFGAAPAAGGGLFGGAPPAAGALGGAQPAALVPTGPSVTLDTPYSRLPDEHKQFLEQLDVLIERTAHFNAHVLDAHGAETEGELARIGSHARELSARVAHLSSELGRDEGTIDRFKAEVDDLVADARHADEAFQRRADFSIGAADGSALAFAFFERKGAAMRRQAEELSAHVSAVEALLAAAEHPRAAAAEYGGAGAGAGGRAGSELREVCALMSEHQRLIEALTASVSDTHEQVESLRREHVRRLGRDPFAEADASEAQIVNKHKHGGVPRAHLHHWAAKQNAPEQPQQPQTAQQPAAGAAAAPASGGGLFGGGGGFGASAPLGAPTAAAPSLFGAPPAATTTTVAAAAAAPAAPLGGGFLGAPYAGAAPLATQTSFGATPFGAAALPQQPNLRAKKKSTSSRR